VRRLRHITLSTGHVRDSDRSEIADEALSVCADLLVAAMIVAPESVPIPATDCTLRVTGAGRCLVATVYGPSGAAIVTMGVATHSRCGARLWRSLHDSATGALATDDWECPAEPWCAVRLEPGALLHMGAMEWAGDLERCLAWAAVLRRETIA
jgi:hypothetical protein